jgi:hypothetical protein
MRPRRVWLAVRSIKVIEAPGCDFPRPRFHEPEWNAHACWCAPVIKLRADDKVELIHNEFEN